ncbi:zinc finger protein 490-like [Uranotaenia lowii]|uniref:zinc finger protein 490-like n=1 Tax=Uranotaenia lowii TaxID=190385 RepID=UPI002479B970|nr:zinc finger protein 490-like [Uranotaenia lowii]
MSCSVPTCRNDASVRKMHQFPLNTMLRKRWLEAVRIGCQIVGKVSSEEECDFLRSSLSTSMQICEDHFRQPSTKQHYYLEPSQFCDSKGTKTSVVTCKVCIQIYPEKETVHCESFLQVMLSAFPGNDTIRAMFESPILPTYVCIECVTKIDIMKSFYASLINSSESLKMLEDFIINEPGNDSYNRLYRSGDFEQINIKVERVDSEIETSDPFGKKDGKTEDRCNSDEDSAELTQENDLLEDMNAIRSVCGKTFPDEAKLLNHIKTCVTCKLSLIKCRHCNKSFQRFQDLGKHSQDVHNDPRPFQCPECDETFTRSDYRSKHVRLKHTDAIDRRQTCLICGEKFARLPHLNEHIQQVHAEVEYPLLRCPHCPKTFINKSVLQRHVNVHTDKFVCQICDRPFGTRGRLKAHLQDVHAEGRPFECKICQKGFKTESSLRRHSIFHSSERRYKCEACSKTFNTSNIARKHFQRVHSDERNFACKLCDKTFKTGDNLRQHAPVHAEANIFGCELCGKMFKSMDYLRQHRTGVHFTERKNKFVCHLCVRSFKTEVALQKHLDTHR